MNTPNGLDDNALRNPAVRAAYDPSMKEARETQLSGDDLTNGRMYLIVLCVISVIAVTGLVVSLNNIVRSTEVPHLRVSTEPKFANLSSVAGAKSILVSDNSGIDQYDFAGRKIANVSIRKYFGLLSFPSCLVWRYIVPDRLKVYVFRFNRHRIVQASKDISNEVGIGFLSAGPIVEKAHFFSHLYGRSFADVGDIQISLSPLSRCRRMVCESGINSITRLEDHIGALFYPELTGYEVSLLSGLAPQEHGNYGIRTNNERSEAFDPKSPPIPAFLAALVGIFFVMWGYIVGGSGANNRRQYCFAFVSFVLGGILWMYGFWRILIWWSAHSD